MPRLSTLSNPTGLVDLDKNRIGIVVDDAMGKLSYSLTKLELSGTSILPPVNVVVIARRGNSELRTDHGSIVDWDKNFIDASALSADGSWVFRVLLLRPGNAKLLGAAENIRPQGLGDSESLIGLEPADLGQLPWELQILEQEGRAVIRFNKDVFSSPAAVEADRYFSCLVFPEAVRQLAQWHTKEPGSLSDAHWEPFKTWLTMHGITDEPTDDFSDDQKDEWCAQVARAFSERFKIADQLRGSLQIGGDE